MFKLNPIKYSIVTPLIPLEDFLKMDIFLIEPYDESDIIILHMAFNKDGLITKLYDKDIKELDKEDQIEKSKRIQKEIHKLANLIIGINVPESIFYFNKDLAIIEWMANQGQFASFGMMKDVISSLIKIPKVKVRLILTEDIIKKIRDGQYGDEIILRPNIFKTVTIEGQTIILRTKWQRRNHER